MKIKFLKGEKMGKTLNLIHIKVHALRMQKGYKPSLFEQEINKIIAEKYKSVCDECRSTAERLKYIPPQQPKSFLGGIFR